MQHSRSYQPGSSSPEPGPAVSGAAGAPGFGVDPCVFGADCEERTSAAAAREEIRRPVSARDEEGWGSSGVGRSSGPPSTSGGEAKEISEDVDVSASAERTTTISGSRPGGEWARDGDDQTHVE